MIYDSILLINFELLLLILFPFNLSIKFQNKKKVLAVPTNTNSLRSHMDEILISNVPLVGGISPTPMNSHCLVMGWLI
ncbi:MAG: hypothetical protein GF329_13485 [Candidatus Lokiarchaeota archaeon]|nr:hypothetical protein [Candidatus Lokiarchaeota archaeon]